MTLWEKTQNGSRNHPKELKANFNAHIKQGSQIHIHIEYHVKQFKLVSLIYEHIISMPVFLCFQG